MRLLFSLHFLGVVLSWAVSARGAEPDLVWPQFRGPAGQGRSADKVPTTFSDKENVLWKSKLPGPGTSSPIIAKGRIFLTYFTGFNVPGQARGSMDALKLHVLCLKESNGETLWSKEIAPKLPEQETIRDGHGYASSTVATDGERLYVFFGKTGVFAFDMDGKQQWQADVGDKLNGWGSAASPVLYQDLVIVNASVESESLIAFDKRTGKERWRAKGIKEAWNTPTLVPVAGGQTELIVPIIGKVLAFDPATGQQRWSCATDIAWYMVPSVVADAGVIYCIGGRSGGALAIRSAGRDDVTKTHRLWTGKKGSNVSSPIVHQGHLYWMNDAQGIAYCADAKTGNILYEKRMDRADQVYASPVLAGDHLYYPGRNGRIYVIAAKPEFELVATNNMNDRSIFNASPAVAGGKLYLRSDQFLYCIGNK